MIVLLVLPIPLANSGLYVALFGVRIFMSTFIFSILSISVKPAVVFHVTPHLHAHAQRVVVDKLVVKPVLLELIIVVVSLALVIGYISVVFSLAL